MPLSDRTRDGIEGWFTRKPAPDRPSWAERIGGWFAGFLAGGIYKGMEEVEPGAINVIDETLETIRNHEGMPEHLKGLIDKAKTPGNPLGVVLGVFLVIALLWGMIQGMAAPLARVFNYLQERLFRSGRMDPLTAISAWRRGHMPEDRMRATLVDHGFDELDIEALIKVSRMFPNLSDVVRFYAREAFEPDMIARYGLRDELPPYEGTLFEQLGVPQEISDLYWIAHWEHASWNQVVEMLRRGQLTEDEVYQWYRVVEIPPFWRDKLSAISWNVPTRVDVRRFYELSTIDEARLREIYGHMGYHGKDLDDYVLWTKVYVRLPDLLSRWKNGWITLDDVRAELTGYGMPETAVEELIQTKVTATQPERVEEGRDLTKSDIYKGVKQDRITRDEGVEMLMDLNFSEDEAVYLLDINVPEDTTDEVVALRQLTKSDILKGLRAELISEEEARSMLVDLRYSGTDADFLLDIYRAQVNPPEETNYKEASKADIIAAVKKGLLTQEEGYLMLQGIGYSPEASEFILQVRTEESPFSPVNYAEFKDLTQRWRVSAGLSGVPMTDEIKQAADAVVKAKSDVDALERMLAEEEKNLVQDEVLPPEATARRDELRVALNRARAEFQRLETEFNGKVAEWRHGRR